LIFLIISILINISFKFNVYDKIKRFKEVWFLDVYKLDQYVYWTINVVLGCVSKISNIKLVLVINWWVVVFVLVLLYSESFKSVTLKQSRYVCIF
jgi:hypothetical protein